MELGEKLKALRTERGLTQEQLAAKLYVSRTAVSKWETGGGAPSAPSDGVRFASDASHAPGGEFCMSHAPTSASASSAGWARSRWCARRRKFLTDALRHRVDGRWRNERPAPSPAPASPPRRGPRARMRALRTLPCTFLGI